MPEITKRNLQHFDHDVENFAKQFTELNSASESREGETMAVVEIT